MIDYLTIQHKSGTKSRLELPRYGSEQQFLVHQAANAVHDEAFARYQVKAASSSKATKTGRASRDLTTWLQPVAYHLISACLDSNCQHYLYARSLAFGRYKHGGPASANPFQLGLMGILAKTADILNDEQRQRIGLLLFYAYRHYVPWPFLNGFIGQIGIVDHKTVQHCIDPTFEDWVVQNRLLDFRSADNRGSYPKPIEERVNRLRLDGAGMLAPVLEAASLSSLSLDASDAD